MSGDTADSATGDADTSAAAAATTPAPLQYHSMGAALPAAAKERVSVRSLLFRPQRGAYEDGLLVSVASPLRLS